MNIERNRWLVRQPGAQRRMRLFCLSYAGGSAASYYPWQAALDPAIEVCAIQLPGRGARLDEPPMRSLALVVETLAQVIDLGDELPFAFFGHSLGGLLAFELARYCQRRAGPVPERLFVSGSVAPRRRLLSRRLHELGDADLIAALRQYNGAPAAALDQPELMALMLPTVRADFALAADYEYRSGPPLALPVSVYGGDRDPHVAFDDLSDWQDETTETIRLHRFAGDHFFIQSARDAVLAQMQAELMQMIEEAA
ncbi:thioesterase II family protein [Massilia scottii]|uniref:thioesterase II family protein n=1 Tax=Massilia scottii TaxID=3057166 RepID=UPI002796584F|nr:alpha/beta fold hydrolase [Massilia sp. CCM 9029]MDQ1831846.1 alpha/beta fold hydrolase [Massilia sp. CCM 9029]